MQADRCDDRQVLRVSGADRESFLQGLVTNDVGKLADGIVYAALLTPQGKYLADFFMVPGDDAILIDAAEHQAQSLLQRLSMYKLRADVAIEPVDTPVFRGVDGMPKGAFTDPRHPDLGWRFYGGLDADALGLDWQSLMIANMIPTSGVELIANDSYILEMRFEQINGVDFRKGCYVGQEVTARMQHKTELRKGLAQVSVNGSAKIGDDISANGKTVGTLYSHQNGLGLAYLRFDRVADEMTAGEAIIRKV